MVMRRQAPLSSDSAAATRPAPVVDTARSPFGHLRPLGVADVHLDDPLWAPRRRVNRDVTLPSQYKQCEASGRLDNFRRAAGHPDIPFRGYWFNDSDVYKWLEAAAWTLATDPDPSLQGHLDTVVGLIAAAQDGDGYLNTYFTFERATDRWSDLKVMHELYCAGHLMQAAVAHHRATGARALLDVAVRLADHIADTFGPNPGQRPGTCGHPEIEMALVELYRETGDARYMRQAAYFVDQRGRPGSTLDGQEYWQDHAPLRDQRAVTGHAVRALYLYAGATDLYAETGDPALRAALDALWRDLQGRQVYITGGAGAREKGEAFGEPYELPNRRAYAETCAAIAHAMWAWRLLLLTGEARYADALETVLYNGVLVGLALDADEYFYDNPLADRGTHRRQPWFTCACCPPNLARLLASLPGYLYATSDEGLWVHLYAAGTATAALPGVGEVTVRQRTAYPWDGTVDLEVRPTAPATFGLFLRVPAWAEGASISVNGEPTTSPPRAGTHVAVRREWRAGDVVRLALPMPVRLMASHPRVAENDGRVAIMRGPLVYCIEGADHPEIDVWDMVVPGDATWDVSREADLLGGIVVLRIEALVRVDAVGGEALYRPYGGQRPRVAPARLMAIPYYAWANRAPGPMRVWLPLAMGG